MYDKSIELLRSSCELSQIDFALKREFSNEDKSLLHSLFSEGIVNSIIDNGYPDGLEIPWTSEYLYIYSVSELRERQAGYSFNANTGAIEERWDQLHWVIADRSSDPITAVKEGGIFYAVHGLGHWKHDELFNDISAFLELIAAWINFFVIDNSGDIFDDDFCVTESNKKKIDDLIESIDGIKNKAATRQFIIGE